MNIEKTIYPCQLPQGNRSLAVASRDTSTAWENVRTNPKLATRLFRSADLNAVQAQRLNGDDDGQSRQRLTANRLHLTLKEDGQPKKYLLSATNGLIPDDE